MEYITFPFLSDAIKSSGGHGADVCLELCNRRVLIPGAWSDTWSAHTLA
jgi:hypothetical protein